MVNNVLFVDDEEHILKAIRRGLIKEKYNKFFATSGAEALEIIGREDIHVVVSDMRMPKMNGLELLTIVNDEHPDIVKVILSGYTQLQQILVTINRINIFKFITKPWDMEVEFKEVILNAIDLYNTRAENEKLKTSLSMKNELYQKMLKSNSEKVDLMKNDIGVIGELNEVLGQLYYRLGLSLKNNIIPEESYRKEFDKIGALSRKVVDFMPSRNDEFSIKMLQDTLTRFVSSRKQGDNNPSILRVTNTNATGVYNCTYAVFLYILTSIIELYYGLDHYDEFDLVVTERKLESEDLEADKEVDQENPDQTHVDLVVLMKSKTNEIKANPIRFNTLKLFFTRLMKAYGGLLSFETKNGERLVLMTFPVRRKRA